MRRFALLSTLLLVVVAILLGSVSSLAAQRPEVDPARVPEQALERDRLRAESVPAPAVVQPSVTVTPATEVPVPRDKIGLGIGDVTVHGGRGADKTTMKLAKDLGAGWMMGWVSWQNVEPVQGQFAWDRDMRNDLDNVANAGAAYGLKVLVRLHGIPAWATTDDSGHLSTVDAEKLEGSLQAIAARGKGRVAAYQIFNEPNLYYEWGVPEGASVPTAAPSEYVTLLRAAYEGIKAGDENAIVVSAGLASGAGGRSMDDLQFLRGMYSADARGGTHFDAVGTHPYGGPYAPEETPDPVHPAHFKRAEAQRAVMVANGDSATPMWATEIGWLHQPSESITGFDWWAVTPEQQADYLKRAFWYAEENWPWMQRMFVFNHDMSTAMWCESSSEWSPACYPPDTSVHWFSILNPDRTARPAYSGLKAMKKTKATTPPVAPAPTFTASSSASPSQVTAGSKVNVATDVTANAAATVLVVIRIHDPSGNEVAKKEYKQQSFTAGQERTYSFSWNVPRNAATGGYTLRTVVYTADGKTAYPTDDTPGLFDVIAR
jgi:polysaccharide biosynthesis protein PslG